MHKSYVKIGHRRIGPSYSPFIIAEMSGNHNQSLDRALAIVDAAAKAKVHAVKLQTYTADTMTLDIADREFVIKDSKSLWDGQSLYNLYEKAHTPWEWHRKIFDRCKEHGLIYFSSPFDFTAVDFLEEINVPAYKIASPENIDLPLIRKVASTKKPLFISSGMASIAELDEAVQTAREAGCNDIIMLKCTSTYPASPKESNILVIPHMRDLFDVQVGISDHTLGLGVPLAAVALGATAIEKHITLSRDEEGIDAAFSLEPKEFATLVSESESAQQALGQVRYGITETEKASLKFRRSLYIVEDMQKGDVLTSTNVRAIRPGFGLLPKYYDILIGKKVIHDAKKGTPVTWDLIGEN